MKIIKGTKQTPRYLTCPIRQVITRFGDNDIVSARYTGSSDQKKMRYLGNSTEDARLLTKDALSNFKEFGKQQTNNPQKSTQKFQIRLNI